MFWRSHGKKILFFFKKSRMTLKKNHVNNECPNIREMNIFKCFMYLYVLRKDVAVVCSLGAFRSLPLLCVNPLLRWSKLLHVYGLHAPLNDPVVLIRAVGKTDEDGVDSDDEATQDPTVDGSEVRQVYIYIYLIKRSTELGGFIKFIHVSPGWLFSWSADSLVMLIHGWVDLY